MKEALLVALAIVTTAYGVIWCLQIFRSQREPGSTGSEKPRVAPGPLDIAVGFVTDFFDTLGIGAFATTSSIFKLRRLVRDEEIPGTMNVGHTAPSILEAFIFIAVVDVDVVTLILMVVASAAGAWLGAGVVSGWSRGKVQIGMGVTLFLAAGAMALSQLHWVPLGGSALGIRGDKLVIAVVANALLGALMTLGIGLFAPCMILVALLGMNPRAAFPIMMGSCAFLMPVGSVRFIRRKRYNVKSALGLTAGGIPGVLLAAFLVKSLPLTWVAWLVVIVVLYTSAMLLHSARIEWHSRQFTPTGSGADPESTLDDLGDRTRLANP